MIGDFKILRHLLTAKTEHYLSVEFDFFKRWRFFIPLLMYFNKNYISCSIFRKKYKFRNNIVVVGLKWGGKNVKRRTSGIAKNHINLNQDSMCIYCGAKLTYNNASSDHIIPISNGGNNTMVNIIVCCKNCNNERGNLEFYEYLKLKNPDFKSVKYPFV